ncbi:diguanylate cyclase [Rheinheimera sp.]|uniref:diguanylate cyclase domain-containing protein n=1 Tax=Rheinheimera sp. TaxID=1869214 RepID=UPI00307DD695
MSGRLWCCLWLFFPWLVWSATGSWHEQLQNTDRIKTVDFAEFQLRLHSFEQRKSSMSPADLAYLNFLLAYAELYLGDPDAALQRLVPLSRQQPESALAFRARALMLNSYLISQQYLEAFTQLELLLQQLPVVTQTAAREQGLLVIALAYLHAGQPELAIEYASQLEAEPVSATSLCKAKQQKAQAYLQTGQFAAQRQYLDSAVQFCLKHKEWLFAGMLKISQANDLVQQGQYQQALSLLLNYQQKVTDLAFPRLLADFDLALAEVYFGLEQPELARQAAQRVLQISRLADKDQSKASAWLVLYRLARQQGQYQQALEYHEAYLRAFSSLMQHQRQQQQAYYNAQLNVEAKQRQIESLDKDNRLLKAEQSSMQHQAAYTQVLILLLSLFVLGLSLWLYRLYRSRSALKQQTEIDSATGISNKSHFSQQARALLEKAAQKQQELALIRLELTALQQIQQQQGTQAADQLLAQAVQACRNFLRNQDLLGRVGPFEFALLLPGTDPDKAMMLAEICRDAVLPILSPLVPEQQALVSGGVSLSRWSGYHLTCLVDDAEKAMLHARKSGQQLALYSPDLQTSSGQ